MSASVQGPEPAGAGVAASSRRLIRALAIAAMLLVAAFAAAPARAQDAATQVPAPPPPANPPATPAPPAPTVPDPGPPASVPVDQPAQPVDHPAASDPPPTPDPAPVDTSGGSPPSTDDHGVSRQPAHSNDSGSAPGQSAAPAAPTVPSAGVGDTTKVDTVAPSSNGYPGTWSGQDTFVVDKARGKDTPAVAGYGGPRGPFVGLYALRAVSRASSIEAKARRSHAVAQATALGGPPGAGQQLPGHNPFFNLLSGPGGSAAGLVLVSILAVLGAAFVLPRDRSRVFRTPTATWRPLAYVPPIELPG